MKDLPEKAAGLRAVARGPVRRSCRQECETIGVMTHKVAVATPDDGARLQRAAPSPRLRRGR